MSLRLSASHCKSMNRFPFTIHILRHNGMVECHSLFHHGLLHQVCFTLDYPSLFSIIYRLE